MGRVAAATERIRCQAGYSESICLSSIQRPFLNPVHPGIGRIKYIVICQGNVKIWAGNYELLSRLTHHMCNFSTFSKHKDSLVCRIGKCHIFII